MCVDYFSEMQKKLKDKYDIDVVRDLILSPDNKIFMFAHVKDTKAIDLEVVHGSLTRIGLEETPSITVEALLSYFDDDNAYAEVSGKQEHYKAVREEIYDFDNRPNVTFPIRNAKGRYWIRVTIFSIDKASQLYSIFITDVTPYLQEEEKMFRKTHLDSLTGVLNKYTLDFHYGERYQMDDFHVMFLDLDNFKELNDAKGHPFGDRFLKDFADIIRGYDSDYNRFYRIGGDEFVGLFFDDSYKIKRIAQTIIDKTRALALAASFENVSVSIGIVKAEAREDVILKADNLLYKAKASGKNKYLFKHESELSQ